MKPILYSESPFQKPMEATFAMLCGGVLYYGIETLFRGWSHWSMALCGAICFLFIYRLNRRYPRVPLLIRTLAGAFFITAVELCCGCIVNIGLGLAVWDYSDLPYNFLGQISLSYSAIWFLLCFPLAALCRFIRRKIFLSDV